MQIKRFTIFVVLGILVTLAWSDREVSTYQPIGVTWPTASADYVINPNFIDPGVGGPTQQIATLQASADEWFTAGQSNFQFNYLGTSTLASPGQDGTNVLFYNHVDGLGALAQTYFWFTGSDLTDFDIEFFDRAGIINFAFSTNPSGNEFDFQTVATHELGHALGLDHSSVPGSTMEAALAAGDISRRHLHADDIAGVQFLYGVAPMPTFGPTAPAQGWIDGGFPLTIQGSGFPLVPVTVTVGGIPATTAQVVNPSLITCTCPAMQVPGMNSIEVSFGGGAPLTVPGGLFVRSIRLVGSPATGSPMPFQCRVPAAPNTFFQGMMSLGNAGIPLAAFGDPTDTRVIPLTDDWLLQYTLLQGGAGLTTGIQGTTDANGDKTFFITIPPMPSLSGTVFYVCYATGNTGNSQSGISHIGNAVAVTIP